MFDKKKMPVTLLGTAVNWPCYTLLIQKRMALLHKKGVNKIEHIIKEKVRMVDGN